MSKLQSLLSEEGTPHFPIRSHSSAAFRGLPSRGILLHLHMNNENDHTGGLPTRPSRLYLPKLESPPATILDHLIARFPQVHPRIWQERVSRGVVTLSDGTTLREDSPYRHGITVFYRKEVPSEPSASCHSTSKSPSHSLASAFQSMAITPRMSISMKSNTKME